MVKKIILFCLPLLALLATLEILVRQIPNPYKTKINGLKAEAGEVTTLVLGSSHAYFGIDPAVLPGKSLNLANVSQTLDFDEWILQKNLPALPRLRNVIIPVSYFSLNSTLKDSIEAWKRTYYIVYWNYPGIFPLDYHFEVAINPRLALSRIFNYYISRRMVQDWTEAGNGTAYTLASRAPAWKETGPDAAARHTYPPNPETVARNTASLRHLIVMCQARGIRPILVMTPTYATYYEHLDQAQLRAVEDLCRQLAQEFQISFLNHLTDPSFGENDFYDADHLCRGGARKLTAVLANSLQ